MSGIRSDNEALRRCWEMGRTGRSAEALIEVQRLLKHARRADDRPTMAACLACSAWFCLQLGYPAEGLDAVLAAKRLWAGSDDTDSRAHASAICSWLLIELGLIDEGFAEAEEAVALAAASTDASLRSFVTCCKGLALMYCRQDQLGLPLQHEALAMVDPGDDPSMAALCLINICYSLGSQGELAEAEGDQLAGRTLIEQGTVANDRAIDLAQRAGDLWMLRLALCNGAENHAIMGDTAQALAYLERCEALPGHVGARERAHFLYTKGEVLTRLGALDEALALCVEAEQLAAAGSNIDNKASTLRRLADVEEKLGRHEDALGHFKAFHSLFVAQMGEMTRRRAQVTEMKLENEQLRARAAAFEIEASHDPLTGIPNRRRFAAALAALEGRGFVLGILDIDRFKTVNDRFSHAVGDAVLQRVAGFLAARVPEIEAFRLGGEEFGLLFPDTGLGEGVRRAEDLRTSLAALEWGELADGLTVTASIGLAEAGRLQGSALMAEADRRLYVAKATGRNCVVADESVVEARGIA